MKQLVSRKVLGLQNGSVDSELGASFVFGHKRPKLDLAVVVVSICC